MKTEDNHVPMARKHKKAGVHYLQKMHSGRSRERSVRGNLPA